eukprot:555455_1
MNEIEYDQTLSLMKCGWKATKNYYYENFHEDYHIYKDHKKKEYRQYFHQMNNAKSSIEQQTICARFWRDKRNCTKTTFSHTLDLLRNDGCPHYFYVSSSEMITDIYFGFLHNKPCKDTLPIYKNIWYGHVCKQCVLHILIRTNNLESFTEHIQKYGKKYQILLEKRPISMCNKLMNLWQITLFFVQTLNYPSIMQLFMSTKDLFHRVIFLLHWFIDRWVCLGNLTDADMKKETDVEYVGYGIHTVEKCHNYCLLEPLYALISHSAFYWKCPQTKWYLQMGSSFIVRYVLKELQISRADAGFGYAGNMYIIFASQIIYLIKKYKTNKRLCLKQYLSWNNIGLADIIAEHYHQAREETIQRMNQCHFRNYLLVRCNNKKCNKKYWNHIFGESWNELRLQRNKYSRLHSRLRVNKWYKCSGCRIAVYCSRQCQKYDWNLFYHKQTC